MNRFLVTGATGNIGKYVAEELIAAGETVFAASRENFDFLKPETFETALAGVEAVFLVRPPQLADPKRDMAPFLQAAKAAGVQKIVFISLIGVEKNPVVPHRKIEALIRELGFTYCFLRPGFFMQNLNTNHCEEIRLRNELYLPAGNSKTCFIDTRDVAAAAAFALRNSSCDNRCYTLTGSRVVDYDTVAKLLTQNLGREIRYQRPSLWAFRQDRIRRGTPKAFANVMTLLYVMTRLGTAKEVTSDFSELLGRNPIELEAYIQDHRQYWLT